MYKEERMTQIKGPALFLSQFVSNNAPFDTLENITSWAKSLGYLGVQIPAPVKSLIDLDKAADSKDYCTELKEHCNGLIITELAAQRYGQLIAVHPAYNELLDTFVPPSIRGNPKTRSEWAVAQMKKTIKASRNMGLSVVPTFSGALLWPFLYPWPPRPVGLVELAFQELARRWMPVLDYADEYGVNLAYEIHPTEDLHDGITFERFLQSTNNHSRVNILYDPSHLVLQCLDYIGYISCYRDYIKAFHVKDAEFNPSPKSGAYGGYQEWKDRPGRFRSLGDGQVDFKQVFTKLTEIGFDSWAVLEWECCVKDSVQGASEGAKFISSMLIDTSNRAFDDFVRSESSSELNKRILGLE
jgi:sugar phosphate isomerase/epimerase